MADHSDDEVIEISRDQFVQTVDAALRKEYGFFFSNEEPNVPQDSCIPQKDTITIEGSGNTSKVKQHEVQCTSKAFISEGSQSHTEDVSLYIHTSNIMSLTTIWCCFQDIVFSLPKGKGKNKVC
ncbi:hypothetical protein Hanom_Chr04g00285921 [Helianthus anomalus]